MGQGVSTAMAMIFAEELRADWQKANIEFPDTNLTKFQNDEYGGHDTGGSCTIIHQYDTLRKAGATARQKLVMKAKSKFTTSLPVVVLVDAIIQTWHFVSPLVAFSINQDLEWIFLREIPNFMN